jgi:hypothetical protein
MASMHLHRPHSGACHSKGRMLMSIVDELRQIANLFHASVMMIIYPLVDNSIIIIIIVLVSTSDPSRFISHLPLLSVSHNNKH